MVQEHTTLPYDHQGWSLTYPRLESIPCMSCFFDSWSVVVVGMHDDVCTNKPLFLFQYELKDDINRNKNILRRNASA